MKIIFKFILNLIEGKVKLISKSFRKMLLKDNWNKGKNKGNYIKVIYKLMLNGVKSNFVFNLIKMLVKCNFYI